MDPEILRGFPARPPSEVEWEDLLVRLEIMPRALRVLAEEMPLDRPPATTLLAGLAGREAAAMAFLETAAGIAPDDGFSAQGIALHEDPMDRFVRFRSRNFAMVQRRGIDVWEWSFRMQDEEVTVHQLLSFLIHGDVVSLADLRALKRAC